MRLRAAFCATLVFGSPILMLAQDNASSATTAQRTTSEQDAIAKAKREFEALKSLRDPKLSPRDALPQVNAPQWHGTTEPSLVVPQPKQKNAAAKEKNWLVDAMEKPSARSQGRRGESLRERERDRAKDERGNPREREDASVDASETDERKHDAEDADARERTTRAAVNPLERYLGEWMTPSDLALLKPVLSEAPGASGAGQFPSADFSNPAVSGVAVPGEFISAERAAKSSLASPIPAPNPYLSALAPPQTAVPIVAPRTAPPPVVSIAPPPVVTAPANPISPSKIPEFAKPSTDDKYFKQLKRF